MTLTDFARRPVDFRAAATPAGAAGRDAASRLAEAIFLNSQKNRFWNVTRQNARQLPFFRGSYCKSKDRVRPTADDDTDYDCCATSAFFR